MASIVYDAALAAKEAPFQRTSYSRRKEFYRQASRYFGTDYGYNTVVPSVDALVDAGLLIEHDKRPGASTGDGIQSSYLPAPFLADVDLPDADCKVGEVIRLKDADGKLVSYKETERVARERKFLEAFNHHVAEANIQLNAGTPDGRMIRFTNHAVYPDYDELYRVYNGGWKSGGRFYGGWWQQVRSVDRTHFLIDGGPTCELDFEMLHPRLIYAASGLNLESDAYTIDGWDRKICKRAFNILLNASNYERAVGAIAPHVGGDKKTARKLVKAIKQQHRRVDSFFHSGAGLRLQHLDSEIAKQVLQELTIKNSITALPIHDSFIVREDQKDKLRDVMDKAYSSVISGVGNKIPVSKGYSKNSPHMEGGPVERYGGDASRPADTSYSRAMPSVGANDTSYTVEPSSPLEPEGTSGDPTDLAISEGAASQNTGARAPREHGTISDRKPKRSVPIPAFLLSKDDQLDSGQKLKRLAEQPLTKGQTIDQLRIARRRPVGKTRKSVSADQKR